MELTFENFYKVPFDTAFFPARHVPHAHFLDDRAASTPSSNKAPPPAFEAEAGTELPGRWQVTVTVYTSIIVYTLIVIVYVSIVIVFLSLSLSVCVYGGRWQESNTPMSCSSARRQEIGLVTASTQGRWLRQQRLEEGARRQGGRGEGMTDAEAGWRRIAMRCLCKRW
jgi:hypothetical protein